MRLIDGDALKDALPSLTQRLDLSCLSGSERALIDVILHEVKGEIDRSPTIEGAELDRIIDDIDYEWLLDQEY